MSYDFYSTNNFSDVTTSHNLSTNNLTVGSLIYPAVDSSAGSVLVTNGAGVLGFSAGIPSNGNLLMCSVTSQTSNLTSGNHIKFNTVLFTKGSGITLDTSSPYSTATNVASVGRFTLSAGSTYWLNASVTSFTLNSSGSTFVLAWYNSDSNTQIGTSLNVTNTGNNYTAARPSVVFSPSVVTRVECRIVSTVSGGLSNIIYSESQIINLDTL